MDKTEQQLIPTKPESDDTSAKLLECVRIQFALTPLVKVGSAAAVIPPCCKYGD